MKTEVNNFGPTLEEKYSSASREDLLQKIFELEHDSLTRFYNRAPFVEQVNAMIDARDNSRGVGYLLMDCDHFKSINDTYGHGAGDAALAHLGKLISKNVRTTSTNPQYERRNGSIDGATDLVGKVMQETVELGRVGGDELAASLYGVSAAQAYQVAERLQKAIRSNPLVYDGNIIPLSMSIGVAVTTETVTTWDDLHTCADEALYAAKANGRNCTSIYRRAVKEAVPAPAYTQPAEVAA